MPPSPSSSRIWYGPICFGCGDPAPEGPFGDVTAVFRERHAFAPGTAVQLAPDASKVHLFDAGTGERIN